MVSFRALINTVAASISLILNAIDLNVEWHIQYHLQDERHIQYHETTKQNKRKSTNMAPAANRKLFKSIKADPWQSKLQISLPGHSLSSIVSKASIIAHMLLSADTMIFIWVYTISQCMSTY